jgi:hypothetical protein
MCPYDVTTVSLRSRSKGPYVLRPMPYALCPTPYTLRSTPNFLSTTPAVVLFALMAWDLEQIAPIPKE